MGSDQAASLEIVRSVVMGWDYLCGSRPTYNALCRLVEREDAKAAWVKLYSMPVLDEWSFHDVALFIGREVIGCFIPAAYRRTAKEIKAAGSRAAKLAAELASLIEKNGTLQFLDSDLMSPIECASLDRIHRGIVFSSGSFSEEVEAQLDALQARDFPDFKDMTTRQAGMNLDSDLYRRNNFVDRLRRFSELADESSSRSPLIARPNSKSFNQHNYALVVCETLHMAYGSPCIEVAATLTSAVFDEVIDADTVKKWWQRRDVESSQGDTSEKSP